MFERLHTCVPNDGKDHSSTEAQLIGLGRVCDSVREFPGPLE